MRSLLRWALAFATLGMVSLGCNKSESQPVPTDVTLHVPGMY
jgi:hypothetical protein